MSGDEDQVLRIEETPEYPEAQDLSDSPLLPRLRGRGSRRSSPVTVPRGAGGVGGSARDGNPAAVGKGAAASGGAAAVVPTPAQLYAEKAYEFFVALEKLNPLKRKAKELELDIVDKEKEIVELKAELSDTVNELQKIEPTVDTLQQNLRAMTQSAGRD
jgi:hypothetical protein